MINHYSNPGYIVPGYASKQYAEVYSEPNTTIKFRNGFYLERDIPNTNFVDRCNVYPFLATNNYPSLCEDEWEQKDLVSCCYITNPLFSTAGLPLGNLGKTIFSYKSHSVVNLKEYDLAKLPTNHRRHIKHSSLLDVTIIPSPVDYGLDVYATHKFLQKRHGITGPTAYTKEQIIKLLEVPGAFLFRSSTEVEEGHCYKEISLGYCLFYMLGNDVYYHVGAMFSEGYTEQANFKMIHEACRFFKQLGFDRLLLGSVPDGAEGEGLRRFKEGFSLGNTVNNFIIKTINNSEVYSKLSEGHDTDMFPRYRY